MSPAEISYRTLPVDERWCVHAYYTVCPWAPDESGRLLVGGADLESRCSEVLVLDEDSGAVLDRFGEDGIIDSFWHTGRWQCWGPGSDRVYYLGGTHLEPLAHRHVLATGEEASIAADMEGAPAHGEPLIGSYHSMLYAAGYGNATNSMDEGLSPIPFAARDRHGLFINDFDGGSRLALSTAEVFDLHPARDRIMAADQAQHGKTGDGLTLMCYCVRWAHDGSRLLFYFGNHCVDKTRGEPKVASIFTAMPDLSDIQLAMDCSFDRPGVHWGWQPCGDKLIGYVKAPDGSGKPCLSEVHADGSGYRKLSEHASGGHPSISPADPHLALTDEAGQPGRVLVIDTRTDTVIAECRPSRENGTPPQGRNPLRVCHHPVFHPSGNRILFNTLAGEHAAVAIGSW